MLSLTSPLPNQVQQQNNEGFALLTVAGTCLASVTSVTLALTPIRNGRAINQTIPSPGGKFIADLLVSAGWYTLAVTGSATEQATVSRVGVGEVFVVAGHSVAQGDSAHTLAGALDERVITVPVDLAGANVAYRDSGLTSDLPMVYAPYGTGVNPGPFGSATHFWAKFAEQVCTALNVPVLLLNSAFGGTNLQMWAQSAKGEPFVHPFVKSAKGFPYVNLKNALTKYVSQTGCRAILVDHGQNDTGEPDGAKLLTYYQTFVAQARLDAGAPGLEVVINRQTPYRSATYIRAMQERMIAETPYCWAGPDYDAGLVDAMDRYDSPAIHLNESGMAKAAQMWSAVVTADSFRQSVVPFQPNPVPFTAPAAVVAPATPAAPGVPTAPADAIGYYYNTGVGTSDTQTFLVGALFVAIGLSLSWFVFHWLNRKLSTN